ncbi:MAG: COG4223 family protein, partial [Hyphomicrobiaceae bacterium]
VARQETAKLRVELDGLKGDVARPQDVASALAPLTGKMTAMENRLKDVVENETTRKANAQRIVMALGLGNLKRVLDRGGPYAAELSEVRRVTGGKVDLSALERFQATGVPTVAELREEFAKLAYSVIRAAETKTEGTVFDRLVSGARSLVRVRRADLPASDTSTEATVARIDQQLQQGNLTGALTEAKKLSDGSAKPAQPWLERVAARANIDRAISALENQLKSSLGSATGTKG